ncbi:MAG: NAD-dependent epimerase/dehydratase family protein [Acidimicrobiia bacterium]|nr:MAG: NAD-dependent epimerase/dehydratase family protein [Acidimicrobiia bacterium]
MDRVLVTGAASRLGMQLVDRLRQGSGTEVLAVDDHPDPSGTVRTVPLESLDFAHLVVEMAPTTIVHLATIDRSDAIGSDRAREAVILGTQALFGAAERLDSLGAVVMRSEGHVYGTGNRSPLLAVESARLGGKASRHGRALRHAEQYARDLSATRGIPLAILRFAEELSATTETPLARLLRLPMVPVLMGFDPLLQFLDPDDALGALEFAMEERLDGTWNVAPRGPLYLSQVVRLAGRRAQPLPSPHLDAAHRLLARGGLLVHSQHRSLLRHGRVLDTRRLSEAGWHATRSTRDIALALRESI